jgi:hypothetical protein
LNSGLHTGEAGTLTIGAMPTDFKKSVFFSNQPQLNIKMLKGTIIFTYATHTGTHNKKSLFFWTVTFWSYFTNNLQLLAK